MTSVSLVEGGKIVAGGKTNGVNNGAGTFVPYDKTTKDYDTKKAVALGTKGVKDTAKGVVSAYKKANPPKAPIEPTVISDTKIREKTIPNIKSKINKYAETGQYYDENGNAHNADGSLVDTNTDTQTQTETTQSSPEQSQVDQLTNSANEDSKFVTDTLDRLLKQTDTDTASQIQSIKAQYKARETQIKEINRREQLATDTALLLGGSARYTTSSTGISAAQERAGIMELADLDAKEISAIAEAKAAQSEKKYKIASEKIDHVEKLRQEKVKKATEIANNIAEENKKARESMIKSSREYAIADLFKQGITDPADILDLVNYDNSGKQVGDITLKEIKDTLAIVNPDEVFKGASADYQTYKIMQKQGDVPKNWSFFDYKTAIANATRKAGGGRQSIYANLGEFDYTAAPTKDVKERVKTLFPLDFGRQAILDLSDEELRGFLDYYEQNSASQGVSLDPEQALLDWSSEYGVSVGGDSMSSQIDSLFN